MNYFYVYNFEELVFNLVLHTHTQILLLSFSFNIFSVEYLIMIFKIQILNKNKFDTIKYSKANYYLQIYMEIVFVEFDEDKYKIAKNYFEES